MKAVDLDDWLPLCICSDEQTFAFPDTALIRWMPFRCSDWKTG